MEWRLIETAPLSGAENMAIDQALFESVQAGGAPVLRFYRWDPPCLSLGRNEPARGRYDPEALKARGIDVVRRPTGGLAVLHDRELTYAVAAPVGLLGSPRASYEAINRALVRGLARLGVAAEVAGPAGPGAAGPWPAAPGPCFQVAAPGEVVVGGWKLVGSAQRCERRTLLQHGSLLLEGDQSTVAELLGAQAPGAEPPRAAALARVLGYVPPWSELVAALAAGFTETLGIRLAPATLSAAETARARELTAHFRSAAWTWRR
jgi:lipoate-protein ligase A